MKFKQLQTGFFIAACLFVGQAHAALIGVSGFYNSSVSSFLSSKGFTVSNFGSDASSNPSDYAGMDGFVLTRGSGTAALADFVTSGGTLVTEWSGADWALNTANLLDAAVTGGGLIGSGTPITFTPAGVAAGLSDGVSNPFSESNGTEFFRTFASIGASVDILATRPSNIPVALGGSAGLGEVVALGYDWGDNFGTSNQQVLLNALAIGSGGSGAVPAPAPATLALLGLGLLGLRLRKRA